MIENIPSPLPDSLEQARQQLLEMLARVDAQWHKARAPIIQRLVEIENLRPPPKFIVNISELSPDQLKQLQERLK